MTLRVQPRACEHHPRCSRPVLDAKIVKDRGAPVDVVLDAEPSTWAEGARIRLLAADHVPHQLAQRLTTARGAFAVTALYVEHRERCEAEQRRTKAKTREHA